MFDEALFKSYLNNSLKNIRCTFYDSVTSTNDIAKQKAEEGCSDYTLFAAEHQSRGRGTYNRSFVSPRDAGLYFSFIIHPEIESENVSCITCAAALAVRNAVISVTGHRDIYIKYINDIICKGKKICGILTEASSDGNILSYAVVGIGINVFSCDMPEEIRSIAGSIEETCGMIISREMLLAEIINSFHDIITKMSIDDIKTEYKNHLIGSEF